MINDATPALLAAENGHLEVLQLLLSEGADIFLKVKTGWLPIHLAAYNGHAKIVDLLIENGSDAMVRDDDGDTP
ncbi:ankyrin, partial [Trichoderma longibrachiatum ATCC 18648]